MGLTAFAVFVIPWVLLAVFLTRSPSTLRLGTCLLYTSDAADE